MNYQSSDASSNNPKNARRSPLWLPYLNDIKYNRGIFEFDYNGGLEKTKLDDVSTIMIYGDSDVTFKPETIEKIVRKGIPMIIHRRGMSQPIYIHGGPRPDKDDTISAQLIKRSSTRVHTHITRQLLKAKWKNMSYLIKPPKLPDFASVDKMRIIEPNHAKLYWKEWFAYSGNPSWNRRTEANPLSKR